MRNFFGNKDALNFGDTLIDFDHINELATAARKEYQNNSPFPHIVLEDFLPQRTVDLLLESIPEPDKKKQKRDNTAKLPSGVKAQHRKIGINDESAISPVIRQFFWELNSGSFIAFLEKISGIKGLLPDPTLRGGGVHQTLNGGLLRVHADFNKHPLFQLDRRINFLIYLNRNWKEEYGGHLELWNKDATACEKRVLPLMNRCVIFNTSSWSFHGHPHALTCPEDQARKSIAMYYYSNGRPASDESDEPHATIWPDIPET